jgi:hypothetical protein
MRSKEEIGKALALLTKHLNAPRKKQYVPDPTMNEAITNNIRGCQVALDWMLGAENVLQETLHLIEMHEP